MVLQSLTEPYYIHIIFSNFLFIRYIYSLVTTVSDGMYYEVTFNGDKDEYYLDAYKKWENVSISNKEVK